jgi:hypothetical protein
MAVMAVLMLCKVCQRRDGTRDVTTITSRQRIVSFLFPSSNLPLFQQSTKMSYSSRPSRVVILRFLSFTM